MSWKSNNDCEQYIWNLMSGLGNLWKIIFLKNYSNKKSSRYYNLSLSIQFLKDGLTHQRNRYFMFFISQFSATLKAPWGLFLILQKN